MRIACVYFATTSVGGIATHLNTLRLAALQAGDTFDILQSYNWRRMDSGLFPERKWVRGGDSRIWIDGNVNQNKQGRDFLQQNYDAICFSTVCPHPTKGYRENNENAYLHLYNTKLPKIAWVMDGYWDDYSRLAIPVLPRLLGILCPLESYATPLRDLLASEDLLGLETNVGAGRVVISPFPFLPSKEEPKPRSRSPLLVWPNQWKAIKGVIPFLKAVPDLPKSVKVELYSNGIIYYQIRRNRKKDYTDPKTQKYVEQDFKVWDAAVGKDKFEGYHGHGRGTFFGNVDLPQVTQAFQRAWISVNLQGITAKSTSKTYRKGSYNNTEVEALYYGACPILHETTRQTDIPSDTYMTVESEEQIPELVRMALKEKFYLDPGRQKLAREFVMEKHLATKRYQDLKGLLT